MASVKAFIITSSKSKGTVKIRFRLSDGRNVQLYHVSELDVEPNVWDAKKKK